MTNTPFLSHLFFYYMFFSLILLNFIPRFKPLRSWYKTVLTCICIVGIGWFVPNYNVIFIGFLLFYTLYTILYTLEFKPVLRVLFIFITILPLIFYKLGVSAIFDLIGISYISFRIIQMFSDAEFMEKLSFQESFIFLFYPPTLLAGPIERSDLFVKNLNHSLENKNWPIRKGWEMFVLGVMYKYVLSVFVQKYAIEKVDFSSPEIIDILACIYSYYFYFFFDFAGYSAMAIGLGLMMGITLPRNFDFPFFAINPADFWKRFHISLSAWFSDYIFKPLYKLMLKREILNKHRLLTQNICLFMTLLAMGLWNGFQWNYVLSGCLFGMYSVIHNTYLSISKKNDWDFFDWLPKSISIGVKRILMFHAAGLAIYAFNGKFPII